MNFSNFGIGNALLFLKSNSSLTNHMCQATIVTLTFRCLLQFQHQCCTCKTIIGNVTKAFAASPSTAALSIQIGSCNIHTLKLPVWFITNKMHLSTSYLLFLATCYHCHFYFHFRLHPATSHLLATCSSLTACTLLASFQQCCSIHIFALTPFVN